MPDYYLSKSDFKLALDCKSKLYYKKKNYPNSLSENPYMQFLAEGGYMVGKLAQLLYPNGIEINTKRDHQAAIKQTEELIRDHENVTIFEAAIHSNNKLVRIDILEKIGNHFNIIEVKSASYNSLSNPEIKKKFDKKIYNALFIHDVGYQYCVLEEKLKESFSSATITPFLLMPDQNKRTKLEGLNQYFSITKSNDDPASKFQSYDVIVDPSNLENILKEDILTMHNVENEVLAEKEQIRLITDELISSLDNDLSKIKTEISTKCFRCEYNISDINHPKSGFDECWSNVLPTDNHIKDYYRIGNLYRNINPLIRKGIVDFDFIIKNYPDVIDPEKKIGQRIFLQQKAKKENIEILLPESKYELQSWKYPLYFIDFETAMHPLPYHKNMRPYEDVIFQWSCHVIDNPKAEPKHFEWISLENDFPNFKFAESLMQTIGNNGTPLMWSSYENTMLNEILDQMDIYEYKNDELKSWLKNIVRIKGEKDGRFIDMNDFAVKYYIHPYMKGRTSIKVTLPAVLSSYKSQRIKNWLTDFDENISLYQEDENGVTNPYKLLPPYEIDGEIIQLNEGTGALTAYADVLFGLNKGNKEKKQKFETALKNYCKLDTLAMVIIWEHWMNYSE